MNKTTRFSGAFALVAALAFGAPRPLQAATIQFQTTDLADVVAGDDLWQYQYLISDFTFGADQGFSIYFDTTLFSNLQDPPPAVGSDWDLISVQPDLQLPSDGFFDGLALMNGASLTLPFSLTFNWLGGSGSQPGSQFFEIYQLDQSGALSVLESGQTTSRVPEPSTLALLGMGLAAAVLRRRRSE